MCAHFLCGGGSLVQLVEVVAPTVAPITTGAVFSWLSQFSLARVVSTVLLVD
jgi:hypothetical protein